MVLDVRAVEGVSLPHFVGVGFGEGQALLVFGVGLWLEHVELPDDTAEGIGSDLGTGEQAQFDAQAVEDGELGGAADFGQRSIDGLLDTFQRDLADLAFVGTGSVLHDGDPVLLVAGVPGLDGAPGELAGVAILIGKGHLADGPDAGDDGVARSHVDGAQNAHFEIGSGISHGECGFYVEVVDGGNSPVR